MEQEKIAMNKKSLSRILILFYSLLLITISQASCSTGRASDVQFSYRSIIDKEYRFSVGRVIPVTISQSVETDGDISIDSNYFFYSSDAANGNFDIYLRAMGDITNVRLTAHPSKDISPAISPDNKTLAFVSFRDDPEGDIFIIKLNPAELLEKAFKGENVESLDTKAINLSIEKDIESGIIKNFRDANPCFSPDGKLITFSSNRTGTNEIWLMEKDGSNKIKITQGGGEFPSFSPDGSKIIYVSYKDNKYGDIYSVELSTKKIERLTSNNYIKLYPSYLGDPKKIIYSSIELDTNNNGEIDLNDRSIIRFLNLQTKLTYPLTKREETSFKAKWLPALNTRDYNGIIIYTDITGGNINLNIIPETGIIPKKINARSQYDLCETYLNEYDDKEKYIMSIESVYNFYNESQDKSSIAYTNRALKDALSFYANEKDKANRERILSILKGRVAKGDSYALFIISLADNKADQKIIEDMSNDKNNKYFAPFAMEDLGDLYAEKNTASAIKIYQEILSKYPEFERAKDVTTKIALISDDIKKGILSDATIDIINSGTTNQKIAVTANIINQIDNVPYSSKDIDAILKNINSLKSKDHISKNKKIMAILHYCTGVINNAIKKTDISRKDLAEAITLSHPNDFTYYMANIRLAEIEKKEGRDDLAESYYSAGINRYSRRFKTENFKEKVLWLINYYESKGLKYSLAGELSKAVDTYNKYINLVTLIHNKRLYPEIYTDHAPKAHVLYIDSYISWKGMAGIEELEKSYTDRITVLRMDFDRAALYGLAYIYTKKATLLEKDSNILLTSGKERIFKNLFFAEKQIDWALFLDDTFIEPYLLKSWIYQYIDLKRKEYGEDIESSIKSYFQKQLWEKNIPLLDKALNVNDEKLRPENEGNIHLNMANTYFLLLNYPRALHHYNLASQYKKFFDTDIERALFHFHFGYTLWQDGQIKEAKEEITKAYNIYQKLSQIENKNYKEQTLTLYKYFALFSRYEGNYTEAIEWFNKIIKFAMDNNLEIDRARYFQEIAFCYKESGDFKSAISYINKADELLKNYPDDKRKYYLKIKLFGIGPFPIWDMGPDTAVIGNSSIFYPLDTWNKRLLSLSMLEEIAVKNNNYPEAIDCLNKKLELLAQSKTSVAIVSKIKALNNLGYYSYLIENFKDAEKYFNDALDLSLKNNNLEGIFKSAINLTNLYLYLIETGSKEKDWILESAKLIAKIEKYKNTYYEIRLSQEKKNIEAKAKAQKREIDQTDLENLSEKIKKETSDVYYSLDIASALLKFYKGEELYSSYLAKENAENSFDLYKKNKEIYDHYKESALLFEGSISIANKSNNKELKAKLLINAAMCYEKIGEYEKAYLLLIESSKICDQNKLDWLSIYSNYALARFLSMYGKNIEISDSKNLAEKNFIRAISLIEKHPLLYKNYSSKIILMYSDYINFLKKENRQSSSILEKKLQSLKKIFSVKKQNSPFEEIESSKIYYDYLSIIESLAETRSERSNLLISGYDIKSPEIEKLNKKESEIENNLINKQNEIKIKNKDIMQYLELN